jgi:type 1 glutamine amidotransferase
MRQRLLACLVSLATACASALLPACGGEGGSDAGPASVLVFSRTTGFRHPSIEPAVQAIRSLGEENGFVVEHTEDPARFRSEELQRYDAVVFLHTTGDPLSEPSQRAALEEFVRAGGGFVGIHAASDQNDESRATWPWYGRLVGAYFGGHPLYDARPEGDESCRLGPVTSCHDGTVTVEDTAHPATSHLAERATTSPPTWVVYDELYGFDANPRAAAHVLLTLDESTYLDDPRRIEFGPGRMGEDHPIAWCHDFEGGRSFYTGLGHDTLLFADDAYLAHLAGGILWAAGAVEGDCRARG